MNAICAQGMPFFGPHRGALRYLLVKNPLSAASLCQRFGGTLNDFLCKDVSVSRAMIDELWDELSLLSENDAAVWLSAGRMFQLHDLGERSWLVYYSENLQKALVELQRIDLPFGIAVADTECAIRVTIPQAAEKDISQTHYLLSGLLMNLTGLCCFRNPVRAINIPCVHFEDFESNHSIWNQFAARELDLEPTHGGENLTIQFDREKCLAPLRTSDAVLRAFFEHRFVEDKKPILPTAKENHGSDLIERIRQSIKSNLNKDKSGAQRIADEMQISVRSLERSLSYEGLTLRGMKQEIQRDTAIELLQMGMRAKEVALHVGFQDVTAFTRAFSKWTGTPPSQIRKHINHGK